MSDSVYSQDTLHKHPNDSDWHYFDFADIIGSRTISSVVSVTSDDDALTITNAAVVVTNTVIDGTTLRPSKAIAVELADGTAQSEQTDGAKVTATVLLSDGKQKALVGRILVRS